MTFRIDFHVEGNPVPQGSTRAFKTKGGKVVTTNDPTGGIERWRGDIRRAAREAIEKRIAETVGYGHMEPLTGPLRLGVMFKFARPRSHYLPANRSRPEPVLREDAPMYAVGRADLDKCVRAVMDALTAVVYRDDGQVVQFGPLVKVWADSPGADITVREVDE